MTMTLDQAKAQADKLSAYAKANNLPVCTMEVVKLARAGKDGELYVVQPAGMHKLFKTHTLQYTTKG